MNDISTRYIGSDLCISLIGSISSKNAAQTEEQIHKHIKDDNSHTLILDAQQLEYLSSAGLRVILRLIKQKRNPKLINVRPDVYDILQTTGFTEMMVVEKAYRTVSVDGCEIIGQGSNGIVYRLDSETIVKTYRMTDALSDVKREREISRKAFILGIPTAIPYDIVRVGDSYGAVYELLNATSITKLIALYPDKTDYYIKMFVDLLKEIHATEATPEVFADMKAIALNWVEFLKDYLDKPLFDKLYALVDTVPKHNYLIHGDYHSNNVLVQNDEAMLIDMDTLAVGHPIFELASMYNAYMGFCETDNTISVSFLGIPRETSLVIWNKILRLYLDTDDEQIIDSVNKKAMIIGYARIYRRTIRRDADTQVGKKRIELCKQRLCELLPQIDTLDF